MKVIKGRSASHLGRLLASLVLVGLLLLFVRPRPAAAQDEPAEGPADVWIEETLAGMTTADKIGQLFLVSLPGIDAHRASEIAHLVQVLRVGGVIISPENENFSNDLVAPGQVLSMTCPGRITRPREEQCFGLTGPFG